MDCTATIRKTHTPKPELFELSFDKEPSGSQPLFLCEPRWPLEEVQPHTVEHIVDVCPFVRILGVPVPQPGNQPVEFMQKLDTSTQCPRSLWTESHSVLWTGVVRRRRNSWWKCRLSCLFPLCSSRLRSRSLTFQFLALVVIMEVFTVFPNTRFAAYS